MRREGRVRGKPTSRSRKTGRSCGSAKEMFRLTHRGEHKRFASDVRINPSLADFCLQPSLNHRRGSSIRELDDDHADEGDAVQVGRFVTTVNRVIEAAFDDTTTTAVACAVPSLISGAVDHGTDIIPAIEEAFHRELGIFENAVEGASFAETRFARKWGSVLSEESWSDVEFLELSDLESSHDDDDDDWFLVLHGAEDYHV